LERVVLFRAFAGWLPFIPFKMYNTKQINTCHY
jgi:hypothetical protein